MTTALLIACWLALALAIRWATPRIRRAYESDVRAGRRRPWVSELERARAYVADEEYEGDHR